MNTFLGELKMKMKKTTNAGYNNPHMFFLNDDNNSSNNKVNNNLPIHYTNSIFKSVALV